MIRIKIIRLISIAFLFGLMSYLAYMQIIRGDYYHRLGQNNSIRVIPLEGRRGRILDRRGVVLADNKLSFHVSVIPQYVDDLDTLIDYVSGVLDVDEQQLHRRYRLQKISPFVPVIIAERVQRTDAIAMQEQAFQYPGLMIQETFERTYPFDEVGAHILGYIGKINEKRMEKLKQYGYRPQTLVGYSGVEEQYDHQLHGEFGGRQVQVNSRGQQVRLLSIKEPAVGEDLRLTIDHQIQMIAQNLLEDQRGAIVVMDADSGEILSMVSAPTFNPNDFVDRERRKHIGRYFQDKRSPLLNRVISGQYPPGSVFKIPVALAGLESRKITQHTTFHCPGFLERGGIRFGCAHVHDSENLIDAIAHSCNVYMYQIALLTSEQPIVKMAREFGLGALTEVDLPYENAGHIPTRLSKKRWYQGDTLNISIGQGDVLTTPIQLVRMMAAMSNRQYLVTPHLVSGEIKTHANKQPRLNIENIDIVNVGLKRVVASGSGTAHVLDELREDVYGKTGTAQSGGDRAHHAWFAGYLNVDKNKKVDYQGRSLAFCVFIEHGGSSHHAVELTKKLFFEMRRQKMI